MDIRKPVGGVTTRFDDRFEPETVNDSCDDCDPIQTAPKLVSELVLAETAGAGVTVNEIVDPL